MPTLHPISFTTCQAAIGEPAVADIVAYLAQRLGIATHFINDITWQERERMLNEYAIDVGWICGAPYAQRKDSGDAIELLAAPVYAAPRYLNRPIYFSDVMVRKDSPIYTFEGLRGARWSYNNLGSHSGYQVVRYYLAQHGVGGEYFGSVVCSGAHQRSMEMIASGEIDASAIDTTVFDGVRAVNPALCEQLRVIDVLGPSSQPPWVIGLHVPEDARRRLRDALTRMHLDDEGAALLRQHGFARFAPVVDSDYDDIREMLRVADVAGVRL
jgi:phosphonate transport system substrate-binding protein